MAADGRKRGSHANAPPAQPIQPSQQAGYLPGESDLSELSNDQFLSWGQNNNNIPSYADPGMFNGISGLQDPSSVPITADSVPPLQHSNSQLVRRNLNRELTVRGRNDQQVDAWPVYVDGQGASVNLDENIDVLKERAAIAQKDAQSKRPPKQIPPFIQKLSSFLDESRNTDLIRWSDDGNSFVVLDEDRFANELIPELFKHNNYASFVRQLNMYGFHKNVGLSDNSMRASETKAKRPSVYSNPYFKRGRPELLWLIQKPKSETATKKKKGKTGEQNVDSDDDIKEIAEGPGRMDMTQVSQDAFSSLQREVGQLQRNQHQITTMLTRLRDENNQYIRQAGAMVAAHERHETSINAILTFLATFYNRSNQSQGDVGAMFANAMPSNQPQGNVVDMGDFDGGSTPDPISMQMIKTPARRPLALLPPPDHRSRPASAGLDQSSRANTSTPTTNTQQQKTPPVNNNFKPGTTERFPVSARSTPSAASPNNADIMNVINTANANTSTTTSNPDFDFNAALQQFENANGNAPLTSEQRQSVLSMMANNSGTTTPLIDNGVNPWAQGLDHFYNNSQQIEALQRMQEEQDWKMQDLADRLQPLSPSGIPGLSFPNTPNLSRTGSLNLGDGAMGPPQPIIPHLKQAPSSEFDINKFLNPEVYAYADGDAHPNNFSNDFNFDIGDAITGQDAVDQATPPGLFEDTGDGDMSNFVNMDEGEEGGGRVGGRVLGSVASSVAGSGVGSPQVKTEDEEELAALPTTGKDAMPARKRRRVGE